MLCPGKGAWRSIPFTLLLYSMLPVSNENEIEWNNTGILTLYLRRIVFTSGI